jgi:hypothetical protein
MCHTDIKDGERKLRLSAQRWHDENPYGKDGPNMAAELKTSLFCGERCALIAVRALLNGTT